MNRRIDANRRAAEARVRVRIDRQPTDAHWSLQDTRLLNLLAAQGVAGTICRRSSRLQGCSSPAGSAAGSSADSAPTAYCSSWPPSSKRRRRGNTAMPDWFRG
jgi:hypothetical protein